MQENIREANYSSLAAALQAAGFEVMPMDAPLAAFDEQDLQDGLYRGWLITPQDTIWLRDGGPNQKTLGRR